jgi:hypothetical protein
MNLLTVKIKTDENGTELNVFDYDAQCTWSVFGDQDLLEQLEKILLNCNSAFDQGFEMAVFCKKWNLTVTI